MDIKDVRIVHTGRIVFDDDEKRILINARHVLENLGYKLKEETNVDFREMVYEDKSFCVDGYDIDDAISILDMFGASKVTFEVKNE